MDKIYKLIGNPIWGILLAQSGCYGDTALHRSEPLQVVVADHIEDMYETFRKTAVHRLHDSLTQTLLKPCGHEQFPLKFEEFVIPASCYGAEMLVGHLLEIGLRGHGL